MSFGLTAREAAGVIEAVGTYRPPERGPPEF